MLCLEPETLSPHLSQPRKTDLGNGRSFPEFVDDRELFAFCSSACVWLPLYSHTPVRCRTRTTVDTVSIG